MTISPDGLDKELLDLFRAPGGSLPHDPFVGSTARRIAAARRSRHYVRHALQAAGIAALILGSRWLNAAASWVSMKLDDWFAVGFQWLLTPLGTLIILLGVLGGVGMALRWKALRLR
jgi:hypothetical protein